MPQLTALKVGVTSPATLNLAALKVTAAGTVPAAPNLTALKITAAGSAAVVVNPLTDQTVDPLATVTIAATVQNGLTVDSWTWRQISGPTAGIQGTGATVTLTAPATYTGGAVVLGVRATVAGTTSSEKTVTINVLPQTEWWIDSAGIWQPRGSVTLL